MKSVRRVQRLARLIDKHSCKPNKKRDADDSAAGRHFKIVVVHLLRRQPAGSLMKQRNLRPVKKIRPHPELPTTSSIAYGCGAYRLRCRLAGSQRLRMNPLVSETLTDTEMTATNTTPMVRQYRELKEQHPGTLLFFRLGDFYELFFEDAVIGARELQITLTARHKERGDPIPMCGVPHHSAANYIAKLVRKGYRVAICEQTEDPSKAKKLVRREVVRVVTPGTPIDPQLLEPRESVYLAALSAHGETAGAAFLDISTGEFREMPRRPSRRARTAPR